MDSVHSQYTSYFLKWKDFKAWATWNNYKSQKQLHQKVIHVVWGDSDFLVYWFI
jgi:hypothetical protein